MNKLIGLFIFFLFFLPLSFANDASFCQKNSANFDHELAQPFSTERIVKGWGASRSHLALESDLSSCLGDLAWQRARILSAMDYWVKKKLNYCHHYTPTYTTPIKQRTAKICSQARDLMPRSVYFNQRARWNYSGEGDETIQHWLDDSMWRGMDCSNYTTFLYNFALGTLFSSNVGWQAGQARGPNKISPNEQSGEIRLTNAHAAGLLVCKDNTLEINHSCDKHGGYLSVIDSQGQKHKRSISASDLAALPLYPGDLLYISATKKGSTVTHVVLWTGKQVGYGINDINPSQIAPNGSCSSRNWRPRIGDWVITDSHYQGVDYRVLTPCFYLNNLWGVRRVIY